jgi:hypothetical protein
MVDNPRPSHAAFTTSFDRPNTVEKVKNIAKNRNKRKPFLKKLSNFMCPSGLNWSDLRKEMPCH